MCLISRSAVHGHFRYAIRMVTIFSKSAAVRNWIGIVERAYDLAVEREVWLEGLLDEAAPMLDRGAGLNAHVFRVSATRFGLDQVVARGMGEASMLRAFLMRAPADALDAIYRRGDSSGRLSDLVPPGQLAAGDANRYRIEGELAHFRDAHGVIAHDGAGGGVALTAPLRSERPMSKRDAARWRQVGVHFAAGLRLRDRFGSADFNAKPEAVLRPDGSIAHLEMPATSASAREHLRTAVRTLDHVRTRTGRADPDRALLLWEGLVAGRWSLVDHFETDGRRFVLALRNDPGTIDPRGLTRRERQVAEYLGAGKRAKEIGYVLGLTESTVSTLLKRTGAKLGLRMTDLASFFAPTGLRAKLEERTLAGELVLIGVQPLIDEQHLKTLSPAEQKVALALLRGSTYACIATSRRTAVRTVANQAQAVYRKMGVRSRLELAANLNH